MTLLKGFNFDLEMFSAMEFFVSLSFTDVTEPIWLEWQAVSTLDNSCNLHKPKMAARKMRIF